MSSGTSTSGFAPWTGLSVWSRPTSPSSDSWAEPLRSGLIDELGQDPISSYAIAELEASIAADSQLAARLGLWGRRVVGEEIGTFQRLLGQFPELLGSVAPEQFHAVLSQGAVSRMKGLGLRV